MAEKRKETTARGTAKKGGNRKKAPSQGVPQQAATPKRSGERSAAKKAAARKPAAPKAIGKKAGLEKRTSPEERHRLIQEAAYLEAEKEGFTRDPSECWLVAEKEVDARLSHSR